MSINRIQDELIALYSEAEYIALSPKKVPPSHPDHEIYNYFNSSLNKMRFARRNMMYKATSSDGGWIVKEMVYDLGISEVAVREMIKDSLNFKTLEKIEHTNRYRMTDKSRQMYLDYMLTRMQREREGYEKIAKLTQTLYTYQDVNKI
tara:strand:+ start:299 stop:742 length:444 start_codon:yes stop_codon:yes gene_type:complete